MSTYMVFSKQNLNLSKKWLLDNQLEVCNSKVISNLCTDNFNLERYSDVFANELFHGNITDTDLLLAMTVGIAFDHYKIDDRVTYTTDIRKNFFKKRKILLQSEAIPFLFDNSIDIEAKVLMFIKSLQGKEISTQDGAIEGFLMFLAQEYQIFLLCLLAGTMKENLNSQTIDQISEFLALNQSSGGFVGLINPLNNNSASGSELREWRFLNTAASVSFLENVRKSLFKKKI